MLCHIDFYLILLSYWSDCVILPSQNCATDEENLWHRDTFDLHIDILGQGFDSHAAASRLMREPLGVLLVHILES